MDDELEKKMLQKLKEDLKKPKENIFEGDDIVDKLRDEFKQEDSSKPIISKKLSEEANSPKSIISKKLSEEDLEKELIDDEYEMNDEDFLENETLTKFQNNKPNEEKINPVNIKIESASANNITQNNQSPTITQKVSQPSVENKPVQVPPVAVQPTAQVTPPQASPVAVQPAAAKPIIPNISKKVKLPRVTLIKGPLRIIVIILLIISILGLSAATIYLFLTE
jgi:hypothetical protein